MSGELQLLTASRLKAYRRCARYHEIRYERGYRVLVEDQALRLGSLFHVGLEAWWNFIRECGPHDNALRAALAAVRATSPLPDPFLLARVEVLLEGYHGWWLDEAGAYEVLVVEAQFETELINPLTGAPSKTYRLAGKIDVIVRERATGRVLLIEHKSSSEDIGVGTPYQRRLRLDGQISTYFAGGAALGHDIAGCIYDVARKPAIQPSQVPLVDADGAKIVNGPDGQRVRTKDGKKWRESASAADGYVLQTRPETVDEFRARLREVLAAEPEKYFQRIPIVRLEEELLQHRLDMWAIAETLRDRRRAHQPKNVDACMSYGRPCSFLDICSGSASLDDVTRFVRDENPHVELQPAASAA